jgi:hypothetical protein
VRGSKFTMKAGTLHGDSAELVVMPNRFLCALISDWLTALSEFEKSIIIKKRSTRRKYRVQTEARANTSARSISLCAIWVCICSSSSTENIWSLNAAWRVAQGQCVQLLQARRHTSAPGRAGGGTHRVVAAGAGGVTTFETCVSTAAELRPTTRTYRRYSTSPQGLPCHCVDIAGNIYTPPL